MLVLTMSIAASGSRVPSANLLVSCDDLRLECRQEIVFGRRCSSRRSWWVSGMALFGITALVRSESIGIRFGSVVRHVDRHLYARGTAPRSVDREWLLLMILMHPSESMRRMWSRLDVRDLPTITRMLRETIYVSVELVPDRTDRS